MHRFRVMANQVAVIIARALDWLCGCAHSRTTFRMTFRATSGGPSPEGMEIETYLVCLDCGRHLPYDWTTMRMVKRRPAWISPPALLPVLRETGRGSR